MQISEYYCIPKGIPLNRTKLGSCQRYGTGRLRQHQVTELQSFTAQPAASLRLVTSEYCGFSSDDCGYLTQR